MRQGAGYSPHTVSTYWVRLILAELLGAAKEDTRFNRNRAPSGPVKAMISPNIHSRVVAGVTVINRVSALIAWFPATWASQITPRFQRGNASACQNVQHVYIQKTGPLRSEGYLLAVRFADNRAPGTQWDIDAEYSSAHRCLCHPSSLLWFHCFW